MRNETVPTFWARIFISGPIHEIEQEIRRVCLEVGLCVTVEAVKFIYTGGEESGAVVGLINYPRFPSKEVEIADKARDLAMRLLVATCQHSVLIMTPNTTEWITKREDSP